MSSSSSSSYVCDPTGTSFPANGRFSSYTCECESPGGVVSANLYDGSVSHSRTVTSCQAEANLVMGDVHNGGYPGTNNYFWYTENQDLTDAFVGQSYGSNLGAPDSQAVRMQCLGGLCVPTGQYYYGYALYNSGAQNSPFLFQSGYQTGLAHMRGNFQCCGFLSSSSSSTTSTGTGANATSTSNSPLSATEMDKIDVSLAMSAVSLALSIVVTVLFVIQACRRPRAPRPIFVQPQPQPYMYK